jgi:hypothetical protein
MGLFASASFLTDCSLIQDNRNRNAHWDFETFPVHPLSSVREIVGQDRQGLGGIELDNLVRSCRIICHGGFTLAFHKLSEHASIEAAWIKAQGATALFFSFPTTCFVLSCPLLGTLVTFDSYLNGRGKQVGRNLRRPGEP